MRFGEDNYNDYTDMIMMESARCPLKHQNEGYLMYLLAAYYQNSARTLKAENRGELKYGKYSYEKSRAKKRLDPIFMKSIRQKIFPELMIYQNITKSVKRASKNLPKPLKIFIIKSLALIGFAAQMVSSVMQMMLA